MVAQWKIINENYKNLEGKHTHHFHTTPHMCMYIAIYRHDPPPQKRFRPNKCCQCSRSSNSSSSNMLQVQRRHPHHPMSNVKFLAFGSFSSSKFRCNDSRVWFAKSASPSPPAPSFPPTDRPRPLSASFVFAHCYSTLAIILIGLNHFQIV